MIWIACLLVFLSITSWTDIREGKIYNWTTYPGMLLAILGSALAGLLSFEERLGPERFWKIWGITPFEDCLLGFFACGGAMVVCYVFFAGQVGGGDIKLIALIGAFSGVMEGLEAMLWAFIIAGGFALIRLVWKIGFATMVKQVSRYVFNMIRYRTRIPLSDEERKPLKATLCLSPSALAAVVVVKWDWIADWMT